MATIVVFAISYANHTAWYIPNICRYNLTIIQRIQTEDDKTHLYKNKCLKPG